MEQLGPAGTPDPSYWPGGEIELLALEPLMDSTLGSDKIKFAFQEDYFCFSVGNRCSECQSGSIQSFIHSFMKCFLFSSLGPGPGIQW